MAEEPTLEELSKILNQTKERRDHRKEEQLALSNVYDRLIKEAIREGQTTIVLQGKKFKIVHKESGRIIIKPVDGFAPMWEVQQ